MSHKPCTCKTCKAQRELPKVKSIKIPKGYVWLHAYKKYDTIIIVFKKQI